MEGKGDAKGRAGNANGSGDKAIQTDPDQLMLFQKVLPFLTKFVKRNEILKLRSVCQKWSESVDDFIGKTSIFQEFYNEAHPKERTGFPLFNQNDWNSPYRIGPGKHNRPKVDDFVEAMRDHPRNPFVGKVLSIRKDGENGDHVLSTSCKLVSILGHHLHHLNLELDAIHEEPIFQVSLWIRSILLNTPQLQQLRLGLTSCSFSLEDSPNDKLHLHELHLPQLKTLQITYPHYGTVAKEFLFGQDLILTHSGQLERFDIEGISARVWIELDWTNLVELHVKIDGSALGGLPLSSLLKLKAPEVSKLVLQTPTRPHDLEEIVKIMKNFPKLKPAEMYIY